MVRISIPEYVNKLQSKLLDAGYEAYVVGGSVRDALLGIKPNDWDLCSDATPDDMMEVFKNFKLVTTGAYNGTITVIVDGHHVEITTFRTESKYSDFRHPDSVRFTKSLIEDLSRRDFTVNAMAYSEGQGLIDPFGGLNDLKNGVLKAVGNPIRRFEEDALRIMRALRFMSTHGFYADPELSKAIREKYKMISHVSMERINVEFFKLLNGKKAANILREYSEVFSFLIPELKPMIGFKQYSPYHNRDVWEHSLAAVEDVAPVDCLRLVMLLHDIGKPTVFTMDRDGRGRFMGHPEAGGLISANILRRMKFSNALINRVKMFINYHDIKIVPEKSVVRKWLGLLGRRDLELLLLIRHADSAGKYPKFLKEIEGQNRAIKKLIDEIEKSRDCITLKDLAIDGKDVKDIGINNGRRIGETLSYLLGKVMNDEVPNDKDVLLLECASLKKIYDEKDIEANEKYLESQALYYKNKCIIFSGAEECSLPCDINIHDAFIIACDSGYLHAVGAGVWPHLVVGDFDSYRGEIYGRAEIIKASIKKDDTDTLMALKEAIKRGFKDITILAALGGRTDHTFANLQLCIYALEHGVNCKISDMNQEIFIIKNQSVRIKRRNFKWFSIFALDEIVKAVTISGAKYETTKENFFREFPRGVSNEFSREEVEISVEEGMILVISSK